MSANEQRPPRVALRFDVDTFQCMHQGVPRLLELADQHQVPMTFFINMGRAASYPVLLRRLFVRRSQRETNPAPSFKLSAVQKLGLRGSLHTLLTNPRVGSSSRLLPELQSRGHEIGLHGGRNHATWQNHAQSWTEQHLQREVDWGLKALAKAGITAVSSFASPGWNTPAGLPSLLADKGFSILADEHSPQRNACCLPAETPRIRSINTNLVGEPGGVGYLEFCQARKLTFREMASEAEKRLQETSYVVMYDHPVYAGGDGAARLEALIMALKQHNSRFLTVTRMARECAQTESARGQP